METKELLTKRRIEKLAKKYENYDDISSGLTYLKDPDFDVFVSHSSSDKDFIKKVLLFLKYCKGGIQGYVDWQDPNLNGETDGDTAVHLKERIRRAKKVIYVVTNESLKSVWCCWEIGFADCAKGVEDVAILPIKPNNGKWKENEYLQQYPWISFDEKKKMFYIRSLNSGPKSLYEWLSESKK